MVLINLKKKTQKQKTKTKKKQHILLNYSYQAFRFSLNKTKKFVTIMKRKTVGTQHLECIENGRIASTGMSKEMQVYLIYILKTHTHIWVSTK